MQNILAFFPAGQLKQKSPQEWAGPCPSCGGHDRFVVWPERPRGGAYMCRGCGASGDGIQFLRDFHGYTFAEACEAFGIETSARRNGVPSARHGGPSGGMAAKRNPGKTAAPVAVEYPGQEWQATAREFLSSCRVEAVRGLTAETCRACGILRNPADRFPERTAWGLKNYTDADGREHTKTIIPRGIVIATRRRVGVVGVTIRCEDSDIEAKGRRKFHEMPGGAKVPFLAGGAGRPVVLVESAMDAALVWQASGGALAGCALMGSTKSVDADTDAFLRAAPALIASPDFDQAGAKGGREWLSSYPDAILLPALEGKDLGERPELCPTWCKVALEYVAKAQARAEFPGEKKAGEKEAGETQETVAAEGLELLLNSRQKGQKKNAGAALEPLSLPWTPDEWDGRPCCFLPYVPARLRGVLPPDLRGMGVPSNGLPPFLRGFSACGWSLDIVAGRLTLKQARPDARNADGCRDYLRVNLDAVAADWRHWTEDGPGDALNFAITPYASHENGTEGLLPMSGAGRAVA